MEPNTLCTYGDSLFPHCRDTAWCQTTGFWIGLAIRGCDAIDPDCPAPAPAPVPHTHCDTEGITCAFADGTQCICTFCDTGFPCGGPGPRWACGTPEVGCPPLPPNAGEPCDQTGRMCDYGYVCLGGTTAICDPSGFWIWDQGCTV